MCFANDIDVGNQPGNWERRTLSSELSLLPDADGAATGSFEGKPLRDREEGSISPSSSRETKSKDSKEHIRHGFVDEESG